MYKFNNKVFISDITIIVTADSENVVNTPKSAAGTKFPTTTSSETQNTANHTPDQTVIFEKKVQEMSFVRLSIVKMKHNILEETTTELDDKLLIC